MFHRLRVMSFSKTAASAAPSASKTSTKKKKTEPEAASDTTFHSSKTRLKNTKNTSTTKVTICECVNVSTGKKEKNIGLPPKSSSSKSVPSKRLFPFGKGKKTQNVNTSAIKVSTSRKGTSVCDCKIKSESKKKNISIQPISSSTKSVPSKKILRNPSHRETKSLIDLKEQSNNKKVPKSKWWKKERTKTVKIISDEKAPSKSVQDIKTPKAKKRGIMKLLKRRKITTTHSEIFGPCKNSIFDRRSLCQKSIKHCHPHKHGKFNKNVRVCHFGQYPYKLCSSCSRRSTNSRAYCRDPRHFAVVTFPNKKMKSCSASCSRLFREKHTEDSLVQPNLSSKCNKKCSSAACLHIPPSTSKRSYLKCGCGMDFKRSKLLSNSMCCQEKLYSKGKFEAGSIFRYFILVIILLVWAPCLVFVACGWLLTYPLKVKNVLGCCNEEKLRRKQCRPCDENGTNPWSFIASAVKSVVDKTARTKSVIKSLFMLKRNGCNTCEQSSHLNPKSKYTLYHCRGRGWVMKPTRQMKSGRDCNWLSNAIQNFRYSCQQSPLCQTGANTKGCDPILLKTKRVHPLNISKSYSKSRTSQKMCYDDKRRPCTASSIKGCKPNRRQKTLVTFNKDMKYRECSPRLYKSYKCDTMCPSQSPKMTYKLKLVKRPYNCYPKRTLSAIDVSIKPGSCFNTKRSRSACRNIKKSCVDRRSRSQYSLCKYKRNLTHRSNPCSIKKYYVPCKYSNLKRAPDIVKTCKRKQSVCSDDKFKSLFKKKEEPEHNIFVRFKNCIKRIFYGPPDCCGILIPVNRCRDTYLHTLKRRPCFWVYRCCSSCYPSFLTFYYGALNCFNQSVFFLAFCICSPFILCCVHCVNSCLDCWF